MPDRTGTVWAGRVVLTRASLASLLPNAAAVAILTALATSPAHAAQPSAYKYVDEKGNVVYSQTPPVKGGEAKKVDIAPAMTGRGGLPERSYSYEDPRYSYQGGQYPAAGQREKAAEEAKQKRLAELEAQCNRDRGTDCKNPDSLQYRESTSIPRRRY
jgi:hypothetical protein